MRRLLTPLGGALVFALIAGLVVGGLGWVTVVALRVEAAQIEASDAANKERLALWQLDARLFPTLGVETNRPFAHYYASYIPYPVVLPENAGPNAEPVQVTSPLLSAELPDWMLLHFQIDGETGWSSPQVIAPEREVKWRAQSESPIPLANCTQERRELLDRLRTAFPKEDVLMTLTDRELSDGSDSPFAVPLSTPDSQAAPAGATEALTTQTRFGAQPVSPLPGGSTPSSPRRGTAGNVQPDPTRDAGETTMGFGGQKPAPGETQAAPSAGAGGAAPANRYAYPQVRANESPPVVKNSAPQGRSGTGKDAPEQNTSNSTDREKRQVMLNKALGDVQGRGGSDPAQYAVKPAGPPAQPPPADRARPKDEKEAAPKLAAVTPPAPSAANAQAAGTVALGGLAGRGASPPKPPAGPATAGPGDAEKKKEVAEAAKQTAGDMKIRGGVQPGTDLGKGKRDEPQDEAKTGEAARLFLAQEAERLGKPAPPAEARMGGLERIEPARRTAPHLRPPAVHLGPMRPQWLHAPDGTDYLIFVRAARLESQTVFQGVVLDWLRLQEVLQEEVQPYFPQAKLEPVFAATDASERTMTAIPARLEPGPVADPPPAGWTPLRFGLVIAWVAVLVALVAVGFGGWSLIDLSERRIRFVSAVTHELRTPLTSLRLYLDLLTSGMVREEEKQREYLTTLHGESERLNQLIENVLDFARLEKRSVQAHRQQMKLADLLSQVRQTWTDRCAGDGKDLVVVSTVPPDQEVCTDARMAAQVVGNLIDNARKYTREAADRRIWLWAKPGGRKRIVLEVEDRGPGVPAAERCSIFRPFRRGQSAETTAGGAGLGLALAKQWAEMLGGSLTCRAADGGVGACFRLELPVK